MPKTFEKKTFGKGGAKKFGGASAGGAGGTWKRGPWEHGSKGGFDRPAMFPAVCGECGKNCEVPFKPSGKSPVFCSMCFKRDESAGRKFGSADLDEGEKRMFKAECASCGKGTEVPFKPNGKKPVYCRDCYGENVPAKGGSPEAAEQFKAMNDKLDQILKLLKDQAE